MHSRLILTICLLIPGFPVSAGPPAAQTEIEGVLAGMHALADLRQRVDRASAAFLGRRYELGALGEGNQDLFDQDPLYRTDAFDCTTFVETVTALALSRDFSGFLSRLNRIRYAQGKISFFDRRHFMETDWIPGTVAEGFYVEITRAVADPVPTGLARARIDRRKWYADRSAADIRIPAATEAERAKRLQLLRAFALRTAPAEATLDYIAARDLLRQSPLSAGLWERLSAHSGAVLNILRRGPRPISHQGFLIVKDGRLFFRHAARGRSVREELLPRYLARDPGILGIHLLELKAPPG